MTSIEHNYIVHETAGAAYRSAAVKVERSGSEERSGSVKRVTKRGAAATKRHQQRERSRGQSVYEEPWHAQADESGAVEIERSGATRGAQRERRDGHGRGSHQSKEQQLRSGRSNSKAAESSKPREEKRSSGEEKRARR